MGSSMTNDVCSWLRRSGLAIALALLTALPVPAALRAQLIGSGFTGVVAIVHDPVLPDTLYVVQLDGLVRAVVDGATLETPFLDLRGVVTPAGGERGLLGMAFPPDAATSGRVFVNFIDQNGHTVIARFTRTAASPRVAVAASRVDLQWPAPGGGRQGFITQPGTNHKGGHLAFGPDSYLYIGLGDGGGDNDPAQNAQNPASLLGKMLRVNVSVPDSDPIGYLIPPGNPAFPVAGALPEIWAFGLRNPWRYSFDDLGNGATKALVIADVGQSAREEIDVEPHGRGGRNYGWRAFEGSIPNPNIPAEAPAYVPVTPPTYEYPRTQGRSVTGGYVYRGTALTAAMRGRYLFGDCIVGRVWSMALDVAPLGEATLTGLVDHTAELGEPFKCITSFARDAAGELYLTDLDFASRTSRIFRLVDGDSVPPGPPTGLSAAVTESTVAFSWQSSQSGGTTTSYLLEAGSAPTLSDLGVLPLPTTTLTVPGVANGTYFVRVRAVGPAGVSTPSSEIQVVVGCSAPPPAPDLTSVGVVGRTVTLGWTLPPGTTRVQLDVGYQPGTTALVVPIAGTPTSLVAPDVPPGTYFARLRAVNACGISEPSAERMIVVP
jgi:glucose/arabinose dehydrogenase